jgi:hypothetical protein
MRRTGFVDTVGRLGSHDHICWAFDAPGEYRSVVGQFLADGLADGHRVVFIGDPSWESHLDEVDGFAAARVTGAAEVRDLSL